jgi:hypothetical protein
MTFAALYPPLRLGLVFFEPVDERALRAIVNWAASNQLPWMVADERPYHALLLARGPRSDDPPDLAVFRLAVDAENLARRKHGDAMPPMALRKPLQPMHVRIVLEMAAASLIPDHVENMSPHTRPRLSEALSPTTVMRAPPVTSDPLLRPGFHNWR